MRIFSLIILCGLLGLALAARADVSICEQFDVWPVDVQETYLINAVLSNTNDATPAFKRCAKLQCAEAREVMKAACERGEGVSSMINRIVTKVRLLCKHGVVIPPITHPDWIEEWEEFELPFTRN
jgi:hypothetical protein